MGKCNIVKASNSGSRIRRHWFAVVISDTSSKYGIQSSNAYDAIVTATNDDVNDAAITNDVNDAVVELVW